MRQHMPDPIDIEIVQSPSAAHSLGAEIVRLARLATAMHMAMSATGGTAASDSVPASDGGGADDARDAANGRRR